MPQLSLPQIDLPARDRDAKEILESWNLPGVEGFLAWIADINPKILTRTNKYEIFEPTQKQLDVLAKLLATNKGRLTFSLVLLIWPRRHSKTTLFALICLWILTSRPHQTIQLLGNTEVHSRRTQFNLLKKIITHTPKLRALIPEETSFGQYEIRCLPMQSVAQMSSGTSTATAFGEKLNVLWVSDLHECPDVGPFDAFSAALLDSVDSLTLIDTNIDEIGGNIEALEKVAKVDDGAFCDRIEYRDFRDFERRAPVWIDRGRAKRLKATQLPAAYARDILGKRSSRVNALFPPEIINQCKAKYQHPVDDVEALAAGRSFKIGAGLDRSKSLVAGIGARPSDATVWTVVAKIATTDGEPEVFVLNQVAFKLNIAAGIKAQILKDFKKYQFDACALENVEVQDLLPWMVTNKIPCETVSPTDTYQNIIFPHLHRLAKENRLHFPAKLKRLASEMSTFTYEKRPGGKYKFGHALDKFKDDTVYSLAAAVYSLRHAVLSMYELGHVQCVSKSAKRRFCYIMGGDVVLQCADRCAVHYKVEGMLKEYQQFTLDEDMLITDFFKTKVKVKGARLYQAA